MTPTLQEIRELLDAGAPTLQEIRELLEANEARHPEAAVLELQLGDAVAAFRDAEGDTMKRFWREGYPVDFPRVQATGVFTGEFHRLMALTLPAFQEAMRAVTRMGGAPELEASGRKLIVIWEETEAQLRRIGAIT